MPREVALPSPVTVIHSYDSVEGLRSPSPSQHARTMRSEAAIVMLDAYCVLVRDPATSWSATDMPEGAARNSPDFCDVIVRSPEQDALGVLAAANSVARYVLDDDYLIAHNLDMHTRYYLATILFAVYKVKTGDNWRSGACMTMLVLEQFLHGWELGPWRSDIATQRMHEAHMWDIEGELVFGTPFYAVTDNGVHGAFEVALAQLMAVGALTERQGVIGIGIVHFYLHAVHINARRDLLEEMVLSRSIAELGAAFAYIVLVSARLYNGGFDTALGLGAVRGVWPYDNARLANAALDIASNAYLVSKRRRLDGAYSMEQAHVYSYVRPAMLQMVMNTLAGSVVASRA